MKIDIDSHISSTFRYDLLVTKNDNIKFVGYDGKEREYHLAEKEVEAIIRQLITPNVFAKKTVVFRLCYETDKISDSGAFMLTLNRIKSNFNTSNINIKIERGPFNRKA